MSAPAPPPAPSAKDDLRALQALLNNSINTILASDTGLPSLDAPVPIPHPITPEIGTALAASAQLTAILEGPSGMGRIAMLYHVPAAVRAAIEAHAAEAIRENGDPVKGLHVDEIAKASNINPQKLARVLRYLATQHIFRETAVDTFANNRLSAGLDTFAPLSSIIGNKSFHNGTLGLQALLCHCTDDVMKGSASLSEWLQAPESANNDSPTSTAVGYALGLKTSVWDWFNERGNEFRLDRFGMGMKGMRICMPATGEFDPTQGFDFAALEEGAKVVDVGGGVGSVSLAVSKALPKLKVVLQDQTQVIEGEAKAFVEKEDPAAVSEGRLTLQAHDFFKPQPIKDAAVYLLRFIVHDWADAPSLEILKSVRGAASASSKLILVEQLVRPLCPPNQRTNTDLPSALDKLSLVPGASDSDLPRAPWPLLSMSDPMSYGVDMQMLTLLNAQERTVAQFAELGEKAGWKLEAVHRAKGGAGKNELVFGTA